MGEEGRRKKGWRGRRGVGVIREEGGGGGGEGEEERTRGEKIANGLWNANKFRKGGRGDEYIHSVHH